MKSLFQCIALFSLLSIAVPATGQITITASDINSQLLPGHTITTNVDTSTNTANIGALGSTSWDFSGIVTNYSVVSSTVKPDTTPYFSDFPGATHGYKVGTLYSYYTLGTDLLMLGVGNSSPFDVRIVNNPAQLLDKLPLTLGTSWTSTYAETTKVITFGITTITHFVRENVVDAYGNLTIPGGAVFQALRLKTDTRATSTGGTVRSIMYSFLTTGGATVYVTPADTNQPVTGTVSVGSMTWSGPIVTSVEEIPGGNRPSRFAVEQNYPNPFNPSTTIHFSVAQDAFVHLKVYSLLGQELATLVSAQLAPGMYSTHWDGSRFPSGVYVYRLQAGSFVETKRLVLVR